MIKWKKDYFNKTILRRKIQRMKVFNSKILAIVCVIICSWSNVSVASNSNEETMMYYLGEVVNAGKNTGYSLDNKIDEDDLHYGWRLGQFFISDYTRVINENEEVPIFLKTVGDTVTLCFSLEQDIERLNKNESLSIAEDKDGYDSFFGIEKSNFGQGTLIIRHTDYQNYTYEPVIYTNYLPAIELFANTEIQFLEEGDYEVSLNYKVKNDPRNIMGVSILPTYSDYKISFQFKVRNGNCMVFPFDVETKEELTNNTITEHGFYLDLAKSRYLDIDIKKETWQEGAAGMVEDTRFNRPAKDGTTYTDEGIYTITVSNRYTQQQTIKQIYVGTNEILKAHMQTGFEIMDIVNLINAGAVINGDGSIIPPPLEELEVDIEEDIEEEEDLAIVEVALEEKVVEAIFLDDEEDSGGVESSFYPFLIILLVILSVGIALYYILFRKKAVEKINEE